MKLWTVAPLDKQEAKEIQSKYGLPAIVAMLLCIRNIKSNAEINDFLNNDSDIADPFEIKDMDKAVKRIRQALEKGEPICVYGDYDADGVTSTVLLYSYLETVGANAIYYIPSRENEGYGMNKSAVDFLSEKGIRLIVTVDNGIAAAEEIAYAKSLGIDTVVTDHHMPPEELPDACAVVDLHQADCKSKFKSLSGVGVVFKLVMALEGDDCDIDTLLDNYSDLLAIGTIGDIVELTGENRVFVKRGLNSIMNSERVGIRSLIDSCGLSGRELSAGNVSFTLVPRINAVGRLGLSQKSVSLFLSEDEQEAAEISDKLCEDNAQRQQIERDILEDIDKLIINKPSLVLDPIIVIDGENWHQGVIGIVASRIKDIYGKPTIIISRCGDEAKASGRSVEGFALCDAVFACKDILTHCGGHPMAVGLSLESKNISLFRERINKYALSAGEMPFDRLNIDCKLNPLYLSVDLVNSLSYLQPFGAGNPTPVFGLFNMTIKNIIPLSNNKHLKILLERNGARVTAMKFFTSKEQFSYKPEDVVDLAVTLGVNEYNGNTSVSVIIKDIKPNSVDTTKFLESQRIFERLCAGSLLNPEQIKSLLPSRSDFALLYRYLRQVGDFEMPVEALAYRFNDKLSIGKIRVIIESLKELGLIDFIEGIKTCKISIRQVNTKVDLESAHIIKRLKEGLQ